MRDDSSRKRAARSRSERRERRVTVVRCLWRSPLVEHDGHAIKDLAAPTSLALRLPPMQASKPKRAEPTFGLHQFSFVFRAFVRRILRYKASHSLRNASSFWSQSLISASVRSVATCMMVL